MKKKLISLLLVLVLVFSLAACGGSGDGEGSADGETIRIGVIGPLTGETAIFGDMLTQTVQLLAEQLHHPGRRRPPRPASRAAFQRPELFLPLRQGLFGV